MKFKEIIKNKNFQIAISILSVSVLAYVTRKNWYYSKGITIKNVDANNKTVDLVFNYGGALEVLNKYKTDEAEAESFLPVGNKDRYAFGMDNWEGITYFDIRDRTKDPRKGENAIVYSKAIDWSKSPIPYDNTDDANKELITDHINNPTLGADVISL